MIHDSRTAAGRLVVSQPDLLTRTAIENLVEPPGDPLRQRPALPLAVQGHVRKLRFGP